MASSLSPVSDLSLRDNIDKLLIVKNKLDNVKKKISFQNEEIIKTMDVIDKFTNCYNEQKEALKKFSDDHDKLEAEYEILIQLVQERSDKSVDKNDQRNNEKSTEDQVRKLNHDIAHEKAKSSYCEKVVDIPTLNSQEHPKTINNYNNCSNDSSNLNSEKSPMIHQDRSNIKTITPEIPFIKKISDKVIKKKSNNQTKSVKAVGSLQMSVINSFKKLKQKASAFPVDPKPKTDSRKRPNPCESPQQKVKLKKVDQVMPSNNVLVKVDSFPLEKIIELPLESMIRRIYPLDVDVFLCGPHGLLVNYQQVGPTYFRGHRSNDVQQFYIYNQTIFSIGLDYVQINKLNNCHSYQILSTFSFHISCTCIYNTTIYGVLHNGDVFLVDMKQQALERFYKVMRSEVVGMVVVKVNGDKLLIVGTVNGDIMAYTLKNNHWQQFNSTLTIKGTLQGIMTYSNSIICYTTHSIFLLDKALWKIYLVTEITNDIMFLDAEDNNIIVLDNCNILHKYIIKKCKIKPGSTVEYLQIKEKVTAMYFDREKKKIYFGTGNILYHQKF